MSTGRWKYPGPIISSIYGPVQRKWDHLLITFWSFDHFYRNSQIRKSMNSSTCPIIQTLRGSLRIWLSRGWYLDNPKIEKSVFTLTPFAGVFKKISYHVFSNVSIFIYLVKLKPLYSFIRNTRDTFQGKRTMATLENPNVSLVLKIRL